jgi:hypothetical protein
MGSILQILLRQAELPQNCPEGAERQVAPMHRDDGLAGAVAQFDVTALGCDFLMEKTETGRPTAKDTEQIITLHRFLCSDKSDRIAKLILK